MQAADNIQPRCKNPNLAPLPLLQHGSPGLDRTLESAPGLRLSKETRRWKSLLSKLAQTGAQRLWMHLSNASLCKGENSVRLKKNASVPIVREEGFECVGDRGVAAAGSSLGSTCGERRPFALAACGQTGQQAGSLRQSEARSALSPSNWRNVHSNRHTTG